MDILIETLIQNWYICIVVLVVAIISMFSAKIKGYSGERTVAILLSKLDKDDYLVINNILLKVNGKTSQIDHVVISNYGIFVIETKNYKGWIIGSEYDDYWKQIIYKTKDKLYNPIKQNYGHIQALKVALSEYKDLNYISIITFTKKSNLRVDTKTDVIYTKQLLNNIKSHTNEYISDNDKEDIYLTLKNLNVDSMVNRKAHVKSIKKVIKDKNSEDICPSCGGKLVSRNGKYGVFKGCSNFPTCKYTEK